MKLIVFGEAAQTELVRVHQEKNFDTITRFTDANDCIKYFNSLANEAIMIVFSDEKQSNSAEEAMKFLAIKNKNHVWVIVGNTTKMREWSSFRHTRILMNTLSIIKSVAHLIADVKKDSN